MKECLLPCSLVRSAFPTAISKVCRTKCYLLFCVGAKIGYFVLREESTVESVEEQTVRGGSDRLQKSV